MRKSVASADERETTHRLRCGNRRILVAEFGAMEIDAPRVDFCFAVRLRGAVVHVPKLSPVIMITVALKRTTAATRFHALKPSKAPFEVRA